MRILQVAFLVFSESILSLTGAISQKRLAPLGESGWFSTTTSEMSGGSFWHVPQIELDKAWDISKGSGSSQAIGCVGIIDTGVDANHSDLMYQVLPSKSYSWSPNSSDPFNPGHNHGTWTAGLLGAAPNNGNAVGINWLSPIAVLRVDGPASGVPAQNGIPELLPYEEDWDAVVNAIQYATQNYIPILSFSGGFSYEKNLSLYQALANYPGLFVCAAGNSGQNLSAINCYPQKYDLDNILVVGASDSSDQRCSFSNYSQTYVDVFAPGENLVGPNIGGGTVTSDGTSGACPIVAGVASLMKSVNYNLTALQIKAAIMNSVDENPSLYNNCASHGRINAYSALKAVIPEYTSLGNTLTCPNGVRPGIDEWVTFVGFPGLKKIEGTGYCSVSGFLYSDIQTSPLASYNANGYADTFSFTQYLGGNRYYVRYRVITPYGSSVGVKITSV